ncbi:MAG: hypothetical protein IIT58_10740 [Treponema sp.]|nr:hypothetical protein [Treponema sp.]
MASEFFYYIKKALYSGNILLKGVEGCRGQGMPITLKHLSRMALFSYTLVTIWPKAKLKSYGGK